MTAGPFDPAGFYREAETEREMSLDKPRVFIVGAEGFLGHHAARVMSANFAVVRGSRHISNEHGITIDVREPFSVKAAFDAAHPDIVLLLAAISDIDRCEAFPEEAWAINV